MSSITITLTGNSSSLTSYFHPEIQLEEGFNYSCCLLDFSTYNSIPNVHSNNNKFSYLKKDKGNLYTVKILELPVGSYEIKDIGDFLTKAMRDNGEKFILTGNKNIMKCTIETTKDLRIDFSQNDSIGQILGFAPKILENGTTYISDNVTNIQHISSIHVDCDLITGSFLNGDSTHTIYQFNPTVEPGYKIIEQPMNLIYLPVVRRRISSVTISVLDQHRRLVDFREEQISCRIHIKRDN